MFNGAMLKHLMIFGAIVAVFGGVPFIRGLSNIGGGKEYSDALGLGLMVLLVGIPLVYFLFRKTFEKVWVRSV